MNFFIPNGEGVVQVVRVAEVLEGLSTVICP